MSLDIHTVSRVELLKNGGSAGIYGARGGAGVIAIYTKKGKSTGLAMANSVETKVFGFITPREFYVPRYDAPTVATRTDWRDVLYWQPAGTIEADGLGRLMFPLSDTAKQLRIVIQGITNEGVPISYTWVLPVR